jgi:hypothetical protein
VSRKAGLPIAAADELTRRRAARADRELIEAAGMALPALGELRGVLGSGGTLPHAQETQDVLVERVRLRYGQLVELTEANDADIAELMGQHGVPARALAEALGLRSANTVRVALRRHLGRAEQAETSQLGTTAGDAAIVPEAAVDA